MPSIFDNPTSTAFPQAQTGGSIFDRAQPATPAPIAPPRDPYASFYKIGGDVEQGNYGQAAKNTGLGLLGAVTDILSRGQYASAGFFNTVGDEGLNHLGDAFGTALQEFVSPKQRLSFSDVIERQAPEFAAAHPYATGVLGFVGDVALDPTTYIGIGLAGKGVKVGKTVLTAAGEGVFKRVLAEESARIAATAGKDIGDTFIKRALGLASEKFTQVEARQSAEKVFLDMLGQTSEAGIKELIKSPGLRLRVGLPFGREAEAVLSNDAVNKVLEATGLSRLTGKLQGIEALIKATPDIAEEFKLLQTQLKRAGQRLTPDMLENVVKYYDGFEQSDRELIGKFFYEYNREIEGINYANKQIAAESAGRFGRRPGAIEVLPYAENPSLDATKAFNATADRLGLNAGHREFVQSARTDIIELQQIEQSADILGDQVKNYLPAGYEMIGDPANFLYFRKGLKGESEKFLQEGFDQYAGVSLYDKAKMGEFNAKTRDLLQQGYVPELDAAVLYAQRVAAAKRALVKKDFNDSVKVLYQVDSLDKLPEKVQKQMKVIGDMFYTDGTPDYVKNAFKTFDKIQSVFKGAATVYKPAFSVKQAFGNTFQSYLEAGANAFKAFDPRSFIDGAAVFLDSSHNGFVPTFIKEWAGKHVAELGENQTAGAIIAQLMKNEVKGYNLTDKAMMTTGLGEKLSGRQLLDEFRQMNVFASTDIRGDRFVKEMSRSIYEQLDNKAWSAMTQLERAKSLAEPFRYWNYPAQVENVGRAALYLQGRRMGYSAEQSAKMMVDALFDYSGGLSVFEKSVMKRLIPFYSYQRFAIPLIAKTAITDPGRIANVQKFVHAFTDTWQKIHTGDTLNESERRILPNYLLTQPSAFKGFDENGKAAFSTFNNFTPLDSMNLIETDGQGNFDGMRTAQRVVLGALTPFLKIPLEMAVDKQFFNGSTIDKQAQNVRGIYEYVDKLPQFAKDAMDFEVVGRDPRTGEKKIYINPYMAYVVSNIFPPMSEIVNLTDAANTPLERAMRIFTGVGTSRVDLKQSGQMKLIGQKKAIEEQKKELTIAAYQGRMNAVTRSQQDLIELLKTISADNARINYGEIRGGYFR